MNTFTLESTLPDLTRPQITSEADLPPTARIGYVSTPPAELGSPFEVTVPDFDENQIHAFQIRRWQSRAKTIPAIGDECLVILDDEGEPWVSAWWPAAGDAPIEGGGGKGGDKNYVHEQGVSAVEWTVAHGLEKIPAVVIFDGTGQEYDGEVTVINVNTIKLTFNAAISGKAVLN